MASPQMLLDTLTANDEAEFKKSPAEFCSSRVQKQGLAFSTTAFGGAVLSGDDAALALVLGEGAELEEPEALLGEPFARTSETYDTISEAFNRACYEELFEWIPKFKEQGGFSTFRFDDFLDARVRAVRPSVRRLMLRATMPLTLGVSWADAVKLVESEALASVGVSKMGDLVGLYDSFARGQAGGLAGQFSRLTGGGSEAKLQTALAALAGGGDGAALLRGVFSSVEQSTALVCNLLGQTAAHEDWDRQLAAEQLVALDGWGPQEQIGTEQLAAMPKLRAFTLETLRLLPPRDRRGCGCARLSGSSLRARCCSPSRSSPTCAPTPTPTRAASTRHASCRGRRPSRVHSHRPASASPGRRRAARAPSWRRPWPRPPSCRCAACLSCGWASSRPSSPPASPSPPSPRAARCSPRRACTMSSSARTRSCGSEATPRPWARGRAGPSPRA